MTSPARQAEADRVELVYYWAINQLGNAMGVDALDLWNEVPATEQAARSSWWLAELLRMLFGFRDEANDLAIAYYRLVRALRTGFTVALPGEVGPVSLEQLRQDFEEIVDHIDLETGGDPAPSIGEVFDEDAEIVVEDLGDINDLIQQGYDSALEEAGTVLDALGIENFLDKLKDVDTDAEDRDQQVTDAFQAAGNRQAAAAMRITMNAARGLTYDLGGTDLRLLGWVRYSTTGTPCGWCAMLISRGFTQRSGLYTTRRAAQHQGANQEEDKYHDNCHCVSVPVFGRDQLESDLFALNREYAAMWPIVTKGLGGKDALAAWRKHFRAQESPATIAA